MEIRPSGGVIESRPPRDFEFRRRDINELACQSCEVCTGSRKDYYSPISLERLLLSDCTTCHLIAESILTFCDSSLIHVSPSTGVFLGFKEIIQVDLDGASLKFQWCSDEPDRDPRIWIAPETWTETLEMWPPPSKVLPRISGDTGSEQAVQWAKAKLEYCLHGGNDTQKHCCEPLLKGSAESLRPRRLINVSGVDKSHGMFRICEGVEPSEAYACLSYCWGAPPHFILTTKKYVELTTIGHPVEDLPATLKQAMLFCCRLGVSWIWIDALCMIQDDHEDKLMEIKRMGGIFQNALVTFVVEGAASMIEGIFAISDPSHVGIDSVEIEELNQLHKGPFRSKKLRRQLQHPDHDAFRHSSHFVPQRYDDKTQILHSRAWTFQECLLSSRLIIFSSQELRWTCLAETSCECGVASGDVPPNRFGFSGTLLSLFQERNFEIGPAGTPNFAKLAHGWNTLLQHYCTRQLSFNDDRAHGIDGVAQKFASAFEDRWIAGMWSESLLIWLYWTVAGTRTALKGSAKWPSWSWLSAVPTTGLLIIWDFAITMRTPIQPSAWGPNFRIHAIADDVLHDDMIASFMARREHMPNYYIEAHGSLYRAATCWRRHERVQPTFKFKHTQKMTNSALQLKLLDGGELEFYPDYPYEAEGVESELFLLDMGQLPAAGKLEGFLVLERVGEERERIFKRVGIANLRNREGIFSGEGRDDVVPSNRIFIV
ncbi:hypothetical protein K402DRAFT_465135, partial [Aulographum hederae CBS 113979]